jgi:16S rRNA (cytidine1402-2'-O)-methyltransferase
MHDVSDETGSGLLVVAATPIGDPEDASARLVRLIATADVIAAEDTRRLRRLAAALGITPVGRLLSYHDHNERIRSAELVQAVRDGATVLVVSDAGMPGVSDPGLRVVRAAVEAGIPVSTAPGPSAVLAALAISGLPSDRFCFEGFPPRRPGERNRVLAAVSAEERTMVFFESPRRLGATLRAMVTTFGPDRAAVVCRELTKTHEQIVRGTLAELSDWATGEVLGEITLVVAGRPASEGIPELSVLVERVRVLVGEGRRVKDAVAEVAGAAGTSKRELYEAVHATSTGG